MHMHVHMHTHTYTHTLSLQPASPKGSSGYLLGYRDEWREVFMVSAEIYIFGIIVYLLLGSGEKQYWADGIKSQRTFVDVEPQSIPSGNKKPL